MLKTQRLLLRPVELADAAATHDLFDGHPEVWAFDPGRAYTADERRAWVEEQVREQGTPCGRSGLRGYAVLLRGDDRLMGCAGLDATLVPGGLPLSADGASSGDGLAALEVELYYRFGRDYWGRGYATEACAALLEHAFSALRLPRVFAVTHEANVRSVALLERLGMQLHAVRAPEAFWRRQPVCGVAWNPRLLAEGRRALNSRQEASHG